jgi:phosphatidyl-myo-inositol alpha-mannosyltransferase
MRVGIVCPYNIVRGGGVQECVIALQSELEKRGHHARILTPQSREARNQNIKNVIFLGGGTDIKSPFATSAQISASASAESLQAELEKEKFDILHFHEPWVPILSRQLLMRSKSANVATFHAKLPDTIMSRTIERVITPYTKSILKYFDELTAVSPAAAQYVMTLTQSPVSIIPNGIDLAKYKPAKSKPATRKTILYIGRLERRKGVRYLIQAFALLQQNLQDTELVIAGDGPDRQKLENFVKEKKVHHVKFTGFVDEGRKLELLETADLFCSPALFGESFGIVLLEALASGIVTVAGNNPGYASVLVDKGALSLVNPKDITEFARRMELLLLDEDLRSLWKKWAAEHVRQYDYSRVVDEYEELYNKALKNK